MFTPSQFEGLGGPIEAAMRELGVPGVAIGVLQAGQEQVAGYGLTNVEHPLPVTPDTIFQIGSITKTFTATAAMRLGEQGTQPLEVVRARVRLDDAIRPRVRYVDRLDEHVLGQPQDDGPRPAGGRDVEGAAH